MISSAEIPIYRFEDVEVDALRGRLKRSENELHLRQQAFSVLLYLIENRERTISKDELINQVWSDTAVVDDALVQCIGDIRRALNDDAQRPRFIKTVPKIGYRFISPIIEDLNTTVSTHIEEVTSIELEIEEESKEISLAVYSKLKGLFGMPGSRFVLPAVFVVVIGSAAVLYYVSPRLSRADNNHTASTQVMTGNEEALRYYSLGVEKAQAVHNTEAIAYFQKAIELDPEFAMAHARIGYVYALMWGQPEKGKPFLERASALSGRLTEKDKLNIAAWTAIADQDYAAAVPHLREIISKFPTDSEAYWRLGRVLSGEGQNEEAVSILRQGLAVDPEAKNIYNLLGGLRSVLGYHEEAIKLQQRYVELAPGEPNAYDSLGMAYQHAGSYAEAAVQYQRALDLTPDFEVALAHFANTRFQQGRYAEAIGLYEKYLAIAPSEAEKARGYGRISIIYSRLKNFAKADEYARLASSNNADDFSQLLIALDRSDIETASALGGQLLARSKYASRGVRADSRVKFYLHGLIALRKGQNEEALENFRQTVQILPPSWDLMDFEDSLANAYLELGQFDKSIGEYERILGSNPNYPLARFHIAQAYGAKGERDLAKQNFLRFLEDWKYADTNIPEVAIARKYAG